MKPTVDLQMAYNYRPAIYITVGILLLAIIISQIILRHRLKDDLKEKGDPKLQPPKPEQLIVIKRRYVEKLIKLANKISAGKISERKAYQSLSILLRSFVYEATKIRVQDYTLTEISRLGMPRLTSLVSEYYEPEFARHSMADISASLGRTKGVIEAWY